MNNTVNTKLSEIVQNLKNNNVHIISEKHQIDELFDIQSLNKDEPIVHTNSDCILIFDSPIYNQTSLSDILLEYLSKFDKFSYKELTEHFNLRNANIVRELEIVNTIKEKLKRQTPNTKIFYCDSQEVFDYVLKSFYKTDEKVKPTILTIKGNTHKSKDIFIDYEILHVLNISHIIKNIILLHDYNYNFI